MLLVKTISLAGEKQFFRQVEMYFLSNSWFRIVETDFLSSGKSIFLFRVLLKLEIRRWQFLLVETDFLASRTFYPHFSDTLSSESYFPPSGSVFLSESSNLHGGGVFSVLWKPFSLIYNLFIYKWNPSLKLLETFFLVERLYSS